MEDFIDVELMLGLGDKSPKERADELESYCKRHLNEKIYGIQTSHRYIEFFIMIVTFLKYI